MIKIGIHQPNFFPWLGYFNKIHMVDKFVILDDVQIQKKAGSWSNRVAINAKGDPIWVTAPIIRGSGVQLIRDVTFGNDIWKQKFKKTLAQHYSKASHYRELSEEIISLVEYDTSSLLEYNLNAIKKICELMDINFDNKMVLSSSLSIEEAASERLIKIIKALNGDIYVCGAGSTSYLDPSRFAEEKLAIEYQNYTLSPYPQVNTVGFSGGLSILDALLNIGVHGTREMLLKSSFADG